MSSGPRLTQVSQPHFGLCAVRMGFALLSASSNSSRRSFSVGSATLLGADPQTVFRTPNMNSSSSIQLAVMMRRAPSELRTISAVGFRAPEARRHGPIDQRERNISHEEEAITQYGCVAGWSCRGVSPKHAGWRTQPDRGHWRGAPTDVTGPQRPSPKHTTRGHPGSGPAERASWAARNDRASRGSEGAEHETESVSTRRAGCATRAHNRPGGCGEPSRARQAGPSWPLRVRNVRKPEPS